MEAAPHKMVNRSAAPRPAPAAVPMRSVPTGTVQLQSTMRVSSPRDPAEKEADATARKIMRMAAPEVARLESPYIARFADSIQLMRKHAADAGANVASDIAQSQGAGAPLPTGVRKFMEPRFGADFSKVRIHTGDKSARLNRQVSAQAFTVGNQIFFGKNQFRPETPEGQELIAHELTHTIQQGAAVQQGAPVQRREDVAVAEQSSPHVQRLGVSDALGYFADAANALPGFRMFTIVLGVNPITMNRVDRSPANILRAIVEFLPGGALITRALDNYGVFDRVGGWVEQQLGTLGLSGSTIRDSINRFLDSLSLGDVLNLGGVWERAQRIFTEPIDRIIRFVRGLFGTIMGFIKDAILRPIAELASRTRGWDLLCAVLGVNPITGDAVPRSAETLIGGFMKLIGQEEIWENIKRGNAISRAWSWFQGALSGVLGFVRQIPQRFIQAVMSLEIEDLVLLPRAFARVAGVFGDFIGNFLSWAGNTAWNLLEIIFSVVAPNVMVYLRRAAGAFRTILQNPVGFVGHLVRAATLGFRQFASRFLTHLRGSLIGWLTGALSGANIYIPQALDLREIIKFVLSVLGLTWQNIRQKIVRVIGEPAMRALETGFELVMTLVTQGPAAAWEKLQESLSNLREMVMEQIMTFVQDRVVTAAVTRLLSMLSPAGAFIQAIIATYNTVMFFVERLRQIGQVAMSFIDSIAAIAAGNIASAANRVEQTMGGMLTLVISFLARIAGLGRVTDAVTNVVNRVRQPIDRALDRVVEWIVAQARRLGRALAGGPQGATEASDADTLTTPVTMDRTGHTLRVKPNRKEVTLASQEGRVEQKVSTASEKVRALPQNQQSAEALRLHTRMRAIVDKIYGYINRDRDGFRPYLRQLNALVQELKDVLQGYGQQFKVEDVMDPLPGFGPATGGPHTVSAIKDGKPKAGPEPDGSARESHHVPAKELAKSLRDAFAAKALQLGRMRTGRRAARLVAARKDEMSVTEDGAGLAAISLHRVTHQNAGGAAVHSSAAAEAIIAAVQRTDQEHNRTTILVKNRVSETLAVNPGGETWDAWLLLVTQEVERRRSAGTAGNAPQVVAQAQAQVANDKASKEEAAAQATASAMEEVANDAFEQAFRIGLAAVQNALSSSVLDGTAEERSTALGWLRTNARSTWQSRKIIKPR